MKKYLAVITFLLWPLAALAGEFKATVVKADNAKNIILVRTDKGEETLEIKGAKGAAHAKEGARVTVKVNDKDGKVSEIAPAQ